MVKRGFGQLVGQVRIKYMPVRIEPNFTQWRAETASDWRYLAGRRVGLFLASFV